jgi:hypothetical protein
MAELGGRWPCPASSGLSLWAPHVVPVSFTLTPDTSMKKLLDEALGLFLHCRFREGHLRW